MSLEIQAVLLPHAMAVCGVVAPFETKQEETSISSGLECARLQTLASLASVLHSTAQHGTAQHSTAQLNKAYSALQLQDTVFDKWIVLQWCSQT